MRKRKQSKAVHKSETLNPIEEEEEEEEEEGNQENGKEQKGFFACYLLTSLCPRYKGHTYIGFTVNPKRRIRQHNGEIRCGAWRTKKRRPWEMVLCIYGFPSNVSALQFEWAWQHPRESLAVRQAAATFKSFSGVANKIKLAYTMLNLPNWQSLSITVNYFSTKYSTLSANCPSLPEHMKVQVHSMDELPCYSESDENLLGNADGQGDEDWDEASNNSGSLEETLGDSMINFSCSNGDTSNEQSSQFKQCENEQPRDSLNLAKTASSMATGNSTKETAEGADVCGFIQGNTNELDWQRSELVDIALKTDNQQLQPREKQSTTTEVADEGQQIVHSSPAFQKIEVIDLLTPSSSCRIMSCGKKRKISSISPVIIDLT